ncbi:EF-hand [Aspergillus minisclerotigenes]|uniref:EF-hand n=1 Tax=Aspergillus minisclerotigenes TaxID=656917 RepID=A0A5N6J6U8_9EURO|nr:EF-hand [Aspergillus minisclerotigenes]
MPPYSREEREKMLDAFHEINTNYDSFISFEELKAELEKRGLYEDDTKLNELIHEADVNDDGKISFGEFLAKHDKLFGGKSKA